MSRNIGDRSCYFCQCSEIELEEEPRPITEEEAGPYYAEFAGMVVASCHCPDCEAKYLGWIDSIPHRRTDPSGLIQDLSFRSTFNDEPGEDDLPKYHIVEYLELRRVPYSEPRPPNVLRRQYVQSRPPPGEIQ